MTGNRRPSQTVERHRAGPHAIASDLRLRTGVWLQLRASARTRNEGHRARLLWPQADLFLFQRRLGWRARSSWFSTSVTRPTSTASLPALARQLGAPRWPGWTLGRRRQPGQSRQADSDRGEASRLARGGHGGLRRPERYNHGPPRMYVRSCKHALLGGLGSTELPDRRADPRGSRRISHKSIRPDAAGAEQRGPQQQLPLSLRGKRL